MAVEVLIKEGVPEDKILFLNLIASPQGIENFAKRYPKLRIITAFIDECLDDHKYVSLQMVGFEDIADILLATSCQDWATLGTDTLVRRDRSKLCSSCFKHDDRLKYFYGTPRALCKPAHECNAAKPRALKPL